MKRVRIITICLMAFLIIPFMQIILPVSNVYASAYDEQYEGLDDNTENTPGINKGKGWVSDDPAGIYNGKKPEKNDKEVEYTPKFPETWVIVILKAPGAMLEGLFNLIGITMDQIVYGRVSPNGSSINYFKFELAQGNFYGVVGSYIYNIFRMISLFFIWGIFATQLLKMLVVTNSSKVREELKSSIGKLVTVTFMLFLMPYIWQLFNYIFDVMLYVINEVQGVLCPPSDISFADFTGNTASQANAILDQISGQKTFSQGINAIFNAMADDSMIGALCYTGMQVITLYFAYSYIGVAIGLFIYYILFPAVCVMSYKDKNVLDGWVKNVLAGLLVPIIDAILLILPAAAFMYLKNINIIFCGIITLFMCILIIPSRNTIKHVLGIQMGGIGSIAGAGIGALALLQGARAIAGGVSRIKNHAQNSREAQRQAEMYDELSGLDNVGMVSSVGGMNNIEKINHTDAYRNQAGSFDMSNQGTEFADKNNLDVSSMPGYAAGNYNVASNYANMQSTIASGNAKRSRADAEMAKINMDDANMVMREIEQRNQLDKSKAAPIYDKNGYVVGYDSDNEWSKEDKELYKSAAYSLQSSRNNYTDSIASAQEYENVQNDYKAAASVISYDKANKEAYVAQKRREIMDKYSSIATVGTPMFNNLSAKRQAELMRQYSIREKRKAVASGVGMTLGAATGVAATTYMGSSATVGGIALGSMVGSSAGSGIESIIAARAFAENNNLTNQDVDEVS